MRLAVAASIAVVLGALATWWTRPFEGETKPTQTTRPATQPVSAG
jgi:hypothetical protein